MATAFKGNLAVRNKRTGARVSIPLGFTDVANALGTFEDGVSTALVLSGDELEIIDFTAGAAATVVNWEIYIGSRKEMTGSFASVLTTAIGRPLQMTPLTIGAGKSVSVKQTA